MNAYQISIIAFATIVGVMLGWHEIIENKISNSLIGIGIFGALGLLTVFAALGAMQNTTFFSSNEFFLYACNLLLVFLGSFWLWKKNLLQAGLAKIILMYSCLLPVGILEKTYVSFFSTLVFLTNTFLLVLTYFCLEFIFFWLKIIISSRYRSKINWKPWRKKVDEEQKSFFENLTLFVGFLAVLELTNSARYVILSNININSTDLVVCLLAGLYFARRKMRKMLQEKVFLIVILVTAVALFFYDILVSSEIFKISLLEAFLITLAVIFFRNTIFKKAIKTFMANVWHKKIPISQYTYFQAISERTLTRLLRDADVNETRVLLEIDTRKTSLEQVEQVKAIAGKLGMENIIIYKKIPFAFWMLAGFWITILLRQPLLDQIMSTHWIVRVFQL